MNKIMEFLLPVALSSGEAIISILIIITVFAVGRGKILPSEKALVIERKGKYSMKLAPGLNLALPFIEAIAKHVPLRENATQDGLLICYEVRDKNIATKKMPFYLLAVSLRESDLFFEAKLVSKDTVAPVSEDATPHSDKSAMKEEVEKVVQAIAASWGVGLRRI
jgi:hypothetical protein